MTRWRPQTSSPAFVLALFVSALLASNVSAASRLVPTAQEFDADFDYVAGAPTRTRGANIGSVEESTTNLRYAISPPITQRFLLRLGVDWQRSDRKSVV